MNKFISNPFLIAGKAATNIEKNEDRNNGSDADQCKTSETVSPMADGNSFTIVCPATLSNARAGLCQIKLYCISHIPKRWTIIVTTELFNIPFDSSNQSRPCSLLLTGMFTHDTVVHTIHDVLYKPAKMKSRY